MIDLVGLGSTGEVGLELVGVALRLGGSWSGEVGRTWTCVSGSGDVGLGGQWGGRSGVVGHLGRAISGPKALTFELGRNSHLPVGLKRNGPRDSGGCGSGLPHLGLGAISSGAIACDRAGGDLGLGAMCSFAIVCD